MKISHLSMLSWMKKQKSIIRPWCYTIYNIPVVVISKCHSLRVRHDAILVKLPAVTLHKWITLMYYIKYKWKIVPTIQLFTQYLLRKWGGLILIYHMHNICNIYKRPCALCGIWTTSLPQCNASLLEKGFFECDMSYMFTICSMGDKGGLWKWTWPQRGVSSVPSSKFPLD